MRSKPGVDNAVLLARLAALTALFVLNMVVSAHAQSTRQAPQRVEIPGSERHELTSKIVNQPYDLYVHLPGNYHNSDQNYPTLYLLDAQWDFPLVTAIYGQQYYDGFIPGIVIVGITWGGESPQHGSLRARDLTPTNIQQVPQSGNAPRFLDFIKQELMPFIASKYRVNDDHILMGSSLGGLFTLYALFHETDLFSRYILTSPAIGWDNGIIMRMEQDFAEEHDRLPVRLYMAIGAREPGVPAFQRWVARLQTREYEGLAMQTRILDGIGHSGSKAEGYTRGLQFVFERPVLSLSPETLESYSGTYRTDSGTRFEISYNDNQLVLLAPGGAQTTLFAESKKDFYALGVFLNLHFRQDDTGAVAGVQLARFGSEEFLTRIDR